MSHLLCACGCGRMIAAFDKKGRPRRFVHGHNWRGKTFSAEYRARLSVSHRGKHPSGETRAKLSAALSGENGPNWKGGRFIASNGYVSVLYPDHPAADMKGYIYEHRVVMEGILGRYLTPDEVVHHIDGDKANNAPENLGLFQSQAEHACFHMTTPVGTRM